MRLSPFALLCTYLGACVAQTTTPSPVRDGAPADGAAREQGLVFSDRSGSSSDIKGGAGDSAPGPDTSTAGEQEAGSCATVEPRAGVDPWSVRLPGAGFGKLIELQNGPHRDLMLTSPTDFTRVGVRLDWGGTIVFFGLSADPKSNVIDANDPGRELQLALYDGSRIRQSCAHDASCETSSASCGNSITFLGWNPVQGGDECGNGAKVLSSERVGDALRLVVEPMQWNPDWAAPDCRQSACASEGIPVAVRYSFELRFLTEHVVEIMAEVQSNEAFDHPPAAQEWPTLYVAHGENGLDLPLLVDAANRAITIDQPANDGFYRTLFDSPAPWVSWQTSGRDYGVGLAMDQGVTSFEGWRGDPANGAPYFHNVRARVAFGLAAHSSVRGLSYLVLGNFNTIKGELDRLLAQRPPFGTLDTPAPGDVRVPASGQLPISGWVLDNRAGSTLQVAVDGVPVATLPLAGSRPDVCQLFAGYQGCPSPGFAAEVAVGHQGHCPRLLSISARDSDGNTTLLGQRRLVP